MHAGERFATEFSLGGELALGLSQVMERDLGVLVLMVDAHRGISGAACRLPELDAVLIARREAAGRRHFDLAHELFHVLTWDAMPPARYEEARETGGGRIEQLANVFASSVLMPAAATMRFGSWSNLAGPELIEKLNTVADELHVTATALKWRLVALGELAPAAARAIPGAALRNNGRAVADTAPPPLFSGPFMEVMRLALTGGQVSVRRMAGLLDVTVDNLPGLFRAHGIEQPVEL